MSNEVMRLQVDRASDGIKISFIPTGCWVAFMLCLLRGKIREKSVVNRQLSNIGC
jgi:hypothetical protein